MRTGRDIAVAAALSVFLLPPSAGAVTKSGAWQIDSTASPSHLNANSIGGASMNSYVAIARNVGAADIVGKFKFVDRLPPGLKVNESPPEALELRAYIEGNIHFAPCEASPQEVVCEFKQSFHLPSGQQVNMLVPLVVEPGAAGATAVNEVSISGGGIASATSTEETHVLGDSEDPVPGFQGVASWFTDLDGSAVRQAGAHPSQWHLAFQLTTRISGPDDDPTSAPVESLKSAVVSLPRGFVINPLASVRCTQSQLAGEACPQEAAIGDEAENIGRAD